MVTKHKTSNYERLREKVQTFARRNQVEDFDVKRGFDRLNGSPVESPFGRQTLFHDDKSTGLARATDAGQAVLFYLVGHPDVQAQCLATISAQEPQPEPPFQVPAGAPVQMELRFSGEPGKWDVTARFRCDRCQATIAHSYQMEYPNTAWTWVDVACQTCKQVWNHLRGEPNRRPTPVDS